MVACATSSSGPSSYLTRADSRVEFCADPNSKSPSTTFVIIVPTYHVTVIELLVTLGAPARPTLRQDEPSTTLYLQAYLEETSSVRYRDTTAARQIKCGEF